MRINRIYQSKDSLIDKFKVIDASAEVSINLNNEVLYITVNSPTNDELLLECIDFKRNDDAPPISLVNESFYLILENVRTRNNGEKYLKPVLEFLDSVLVIIIFMPEIIYNKLNQNTISLITKEFYPDLTYEIDGIEYRLLHSASNLV